MSLNPFLFKRSHSLHCLFAINLSFFLKHVRPSFSFDFLFSACSNWRCNDEFHEPVEDTGSSSQGRCRGRQCPRDDRRPCFSNRVSSACGVTSVRGHQRINDVKSRQWEPTMHQLSVPAPPSQTSSCPEKPH